MVQFLLVLLCQAVFVSSLPVYGNEFDLVICSLDSAESLSCPKNEECVLTDPTEKSSGRCRCENGFVRAASTGVCTSTAPTNILLTSTSAEIAPYSPAQDNTSAVLFDVDGPPSVRLPENSATLRVFLDESEVESESSYRYHWELIDGTGLATAASYNEASLKLTKLKEGRLVFRVTVSNETHSGRREYVLTVLPRQRPKQPPRAVIRPESPVRGTEGSQIVLDAEGSTPGGDGKIVSHKWSQDEGPSISLPAMDTAILRLDQMVKGEYEFTVVVTDDDNLSSNASVHVIVTAERDDPPKAHIYQCGSLDTGSITVRLPLDELKLCGNGSTDDKGVESYSWFRVDKLAAKLSVDTAGSSSDTLTLTNIQANEKFGPYEFELEVKDTKGQKDSARISVFVNKAENMAPVVDAGGNHTVLLPETGIVLDGNVKDDGSIVSYQWEQVSGPLPAAFSNKDKAKSTVSGLEEGDYVFRLTVVDDGGLNGTAVAYISVQRSKNEPPVARSHNVTVFLPTSVAVLNGSESNDDAGVVSYKWEPAEEVPAALMALDGSDSRAVLFVTGLVKGTHFFTLTVTDQQKATDSVLVQLTVEQGEEDLESVEMVIDTDITDWSYRLRTKLQTRIAAVLASAIPEINKVDVHFSKFEQIPRDGRLLVSFWSQTDVQAEMRRKRSMISPKGILRARDTVVILQQEWSMLQEFRIVTIQPLYCHSDCSGHGLCSDATKECTCDRFWMTSLLTLMTNGWQHTDCSWSSVYFWLLATILPLAIFLCVLFRRRSPIWGRVSRRRFTRRRKRYSALNSDSDDVHSLQRLRNEPRLQPLPIPPSSSESLHSESDDLLNEDNSWEMDTKAVR